jgi:serine/threonine-protein kinase
MLRVRQQLGKYKIMRRIAEGGFANVYDAYDTIEGVRVALKVPNDQALNGSGRDELLHEVRLTAKLEHPNILSIKNAGLEGEKFVIVHRLGRESLADRLTRRISPASALQIADDVLGGVAFAHESRIVHRDIKPDNVILLDDGRACLADFGIAKIALKSRAVTEEGSGTLGYMAPEQALGKPTFRSDVFSLGLLLWRLFGGHLPTWPFRQPMSGYDRIKANLGPDAVAVLARALEVDDRRRYADAGALRDAFKKATRAMRRKARERSHPPQSQKAKKQGKKSGTGNGTGNGTKWKAQRERESKRLLGKRLGEHTECGNCGGPVAEMMAFCPWCAVERKVHEGETQKACQCERCHRGMKPDWKYCVSCYGPKVEEPSTREYVDRSYVRRCLNPRCSRKTMIPFSKYCPWCRIKVQRPWRSLEGSRGCKCCGWSVFPGFWDYCPWCGKAENRGSRRTWGSKRHT